MKWLFSTYLCIFFFACTNNKKEKGDLPTFNLLMVDSSTVFNTANIPTGKPFILLFFSPDCEHCQNETEDIIKNIKSLRNFQFYFITIDPFERLKIFNSYYKIYHYPNIILGRDYTYSFLKYFKPSGPPYLVLYDKNKNQKVIFEGEAKTNQLLEQIKNL